MNLANLCREITLQEIDTHVFTYAYGIKGFAADNNSVTKWCLNRPEQAKNSVDIYKALCKITSLPSQITKSESNVSQPVQILENDYINAFSITLEATKLFILFYLFIYLFIYHAINLQVAYIIQF